MIPFMELQIQSYMKADTSMTDWSYGLSRAQSTRYREFYNQYRDHETLHLLVILVYNQGDASSVHVPP